MKKLWTRFAGLWLGLMMVAACTNAAMAAPVDDLIAGHIIESFGGLNTATLAIPNRVQEWARLVY